MTRGDIEEWLAERSHEAAKLQLDILWWAKTSAWLGRVLINSVHVRFAPKATAIVRRCDMTRWAKKRHLHRRKAPNFTIMKLVTDLPI